MSFMASSAGDAEVAMNTDMKVAWHDRVGLENNREGVLLREGGTLSDNLKDFL